MRRRMIAMMVLGLVSISSSRAADWPAYHADARRSAYTSEAVSGKLQLAWSFESPHAPTPAWARNGRIRYDDVFQPVIAGGAVYFGDHAEGTVRSLDLKTGRQKWRFQTGGPIRVAPTVWKDTVIVASDDGRIYSLKTSDGSVRWMIRPGPSNQLVLGNEYMISKWPVRGAPTLEGDTVYVGAGVWPSDGFYLLALDAHSGKVRWRNDNSGSITLRQPHGASSKSGPAAQGYLTVSDTKLLIPPGRSLPAVFDKADGKFGHINFGEKIGGGTFMTHKDVYTCGGGIWRIRDSRRMESYMPMKRTSEWPLIEALPHSAITPTGVVSAREKLVQGFTWTVKSRADRRRGEVTSTYESTGLKSDWGTTASGPVGDLIVADQNVILGLDGAIEMIDRKTQKKTPIASKLNGSVGGLAFADGHLIASTTTGTIYCLSAGGADPNAPTASTKHVKPVIDADPESKDNRQSRRGD